MLKAQNSVITDTELGIRLKHRLDFTYYIYQAVDTGNNVN